MMMNQRSAGPIVLVAASAVALIVTIRIALGSLRGQRLDQRALTSVYAGPDAKRTLLSLLGYVSIGTAAAALLICAALAMIQGHVRLALAAAVVIVGANVTTQVLKHDVLDRPDLGFTTLNSLPSGHTTVVASVVLATLLVAPTALRSIFTIAGSFAVTLTGASTVVAGWHRPGDVIAALAVCLLWASAAAVVIGVSRTGSGFLQKLIGSLLGSVGAGIFLVVVGVRPAGGWEGSVDAVAVLGVIGVASSFVVAAFAKYAPSHP